LQSIGVSVADMDTAKTLFADRLEWAEIGSRRLEVDDAECAAFAMGDAVIEAMRGNDESSPVARHARETKGIYCLTFKVKSARQAADYLRGKGLDLIGNVDDRFAIAPAQAFDRLIYFTGNEVAGYPPPGSKLTTPGEFPA
jgi:hypothetical protein